MKSFAAPCRNGSYPNKGIDTKNAVLSFQSFQPRRNGSYPNKGIDTIFGRYDASPIMAVEMEVTRIRELTRRTQCYRSNLSNLVEMEVTRIRELTHLIYFCSQTLKSCRNGSYPNKGIDTNKSGICNRNIRSVEMEVTRIRELTPANAVAAVIVAIRRNGSYPNKGIDTRLFCV